MHVHPSEFGLLLLPAEAAVALCLLVAIVKDPARSEDEAANQLDGEEHERRGPINVAGDLPGHGPHKLIERLGHRPQNTHDRTTSPGFSRLSKKSSRWSSAISFPVVTTTS